jgi:hypothetical protein
VLARTLPVVRAPRNHAQTAQNLKRSLRNAAAGARLIQADGLDSMSAAEVAASRAVPSKSFTGSSAASIDVSDVLQLSNSRPTVPGRCLEYSRGVHGHLRYIESVLAVLALASFGEDLIRTFWALFHLRRVLTLVIGQPEAKQRRAHDHGEYT